MAEKKHDWSQFRLRIFINVPVSKVFDAWTNDDIVSRWFTVKTIIEPKRNGSIYNGFVDKLHICYGRS